MGKKIATWTIVGTLAVAELTAVIQGCTSSGRLTPGLTSKIQYKTHTEGKITQLSGLTTTQDNRFKRTIFIDGIEFLIEGEKEKLEKYYSGQTVKIGYNDPTNYSITY